MTEIDPRMLVVYAERRQHLIFDLGTIFVSRAPEEIRSRAYAYAGILGKDGIGRLPEIIKFLRVHKNYNPDYTDYLPDLTDDDLREIDQRQRGVAPK